jgi:sulfite reductase (NADPH) flavoprotein alpha-component
METIFNLYITMLVQKKLDHLYALASQSSTAELIWMSGYLAGIAAQSNLKEPPKDAVQTKDVDTITIIYGTETGNSKKAATATTTALKRANIKTRLVAAENYKPELLEKETFVLIVISTQGEGEPPATGRALYDYLHTRNIPLAHLQYGILALGSKSYPLFCQAGKDIDAQLERLQAQKAIATVLCDDDFEADAEIWIQSLLNTLQNPIISAPIPTVIKRPAEGKKFFKGSLGYKVLLNDNGSNKQVYHLEFDLPEEIVYNPGNAVGIVPYNRDAEVAAILSILQLSPAKKIPFQNEDKPLEVVFKTKVNIQNLPASVVKKYGDLVQARIPETRMQLADLLKIYPLQSIEQLPALIDLLPGITPRLYTISSSPATHVCQLHLTVQAHNFAVGEKQMKGLGSEYLTGLKPGTEIEFFLHTQKSFMLPPEDRDVIMIGQGTGIAPFRSFIAERDTTGATGKNWLFFGEENRVTDFYYQAELQNWLSIGSLHYMEMAFQKNTLQPRGLADALMAKSEQVWQWLENGSYLMISGEKEPAGKAVESALMQLIISNMGGDEKKASQYYKQLQKEGRIAKELY